MDGIGRALTGVSLVVVLTLGVAGTAQAELMQFTYDPSLNTLPEAQGWIRQVSGTEASQNVGAGAFMQLATASNSETLYRRRHGDFDFSSSIGTTLEASVLVKQSEYVALGDAWRTGFALAMTDSLDRHFILGIARDGVRLTNDVNNWSNGDSSTFLALDSMTGWNDFKLVARDDLAELFINGEKMLELGVGAAVALPELTNSFRFGDLSTAAVSSTSLTHITATAVPEPSSLVLLVGMFGLAVGGWYRRRRV